MRKEGDDSVFIGHACMRTLVLKSPETWPYQVEGLHSFYRIIKCCSYSWLLTLLFSFDVSYTTFESILLYFSS